MSETLSNPCSHHLPVPQIRLSPLLLSVVAGTQRFGLAIRFNAGIIDQPSFAGNTHIPCVLDCGLTGQCMCATAVRPWVPGNRDCAHLWGKPVGGCIMGNAVLGILMGKSLLVECRTWLLVLSAGR